MVRNEVNMNNSVKWSWFNVPVKVKQINEKIFSDTTKSNNIKEQWVTWEWMKAKWQWDEATKPGQFRRYPSKTRLGRETKEEKESEKDEFLVF